MPYATPTTASEFEDLIALIVWPADCNEQMYAMTNILEILSALMLGWQLLSPIRLHVASDTPPGLADWQSAWVDQGRELPITGDVIGLWETITLDSKDSGQYVWVEGDMRPTLAEWWNGSSEFILTNTSMYTNAVAPSPLTTTYTALIAQPLVLQRPAYIRSAYGHNEMSVAVANLIGWRSSLEGASDVRGLLTRPNSGTGRRIPQIRFQPSTKISSSTLTFYFKTTSGTATLFFKNGAGTRKVESGLLLNAVWPDIIQFLGEISALSTEAIYLA